MYGKISEIKLNLFSNTFVNSTLKQKVVKIRSYENHRYFKKGNP